MSQYQIITKEELLGLEEDPRNPADDDYDHDAHDQDIENDEDLRDPLGNPIQPGETVVMNFNDVVQTKGSKGRYSGTGATVPPGVYRLWHRYTGVFYVGISTWSKGPNTGAIDRWLQHAIKMANAFDIHPGTAKDTPGWDAMRRIVNFMDQYDNLHSEAIGEIDRKQFVKEVKIKFTAYPMDFPPADLANIESREIQYRLGRGEFLSNSQFKAKQTAATNKRQDKGRRAAAGEIRAQIKAEKAEAIASRLADINAGRAEAGKGPLGRIPNVDRTEVTQAINDKWKKKMNETADADVLSWLSRLI